MTYFRKFIVIALLWVPVAVQAAMAPTAPFAAEPERAQLVRNLVQREHVRQQLIELGVDPIAAAERVDRMTEQQVSTIQGKMTELPAGGVSTTNLLLIVLILILLL